ncbi:hypothetical protein H7I76_20045 [Mycolicibacterium vaccae]|uniref:Uncharacterized protein n=2 Tax=Mycolicibacterium vaccae TaxID=1810 RepID=K0UTX7_MYCVA|nr:hypothetical protein [Mycolicibacterium vaccae]EJZ10246.1 hypothetical protein MVAC_10091 [Mycolicibacterium vaccae ATCC 25954]MCV7062103.1 hypothetical protein [Mycolicibacterium vaccae]
MTSQNTNRSPMHRVATGALTGAALAFGLIIGVAPTATAQPATPVQPSPAAPGQPAQPGQPGQPGQPRMMTADQALAIVARDYDLGAGGGQLSKLIDQVMTLRARGFRASPANQQAIVAALDRRPDQKPLIEALKATLAYQRKVMAQSQGAQQQAPAAPGPQTGMGPIGPSWAPGQGNPMIQDGDTIFPMPGR